MSLTEAQKICLLVAVTLGIPVERVKCTFKHNHFELAFDPPLQKEEGRSNLLADLVKQLQQAIRDELQ